VRDEDVDLASLLEDADGVSFHAARCGSSSRSSVDCYLLAEEADQACIPGAQPAGIVGVTTTSATAYRSSAPEKSAGDRHALSWRSALAAPERLSASLWVPETRIAAR
jgi:hypothetical protein